MSLKERASYYYLTQGRHCQEGILLAAKEVYGLEISDDTLASYAGFATGMGCGSTCGALIGCIAVLGVKYKGREDLKALCGAFVAEFTSKFGTVDCTPIAGKYKTPAMRCNPTIEMTAELLEAYINKLDGVVPEKKDVCTLTPADIKRVKGMGFLQHVGTDEFNGRIITRNGRITTAEMKAVQEAAEKYGDGHVMLTTRLTMEVSGIKYNDIDAFRALVQSAGLDTGGTGSLVRPVVSCKGTTCQYGNYDTYKLSEEIHKRFYLGYRTVSLPHKFKIATGGCPNNCVKPQLNDLGIVGIKVPDYDSDKCRKCKKCQIVESCPIKIAKIGEDGKMAIPTEKCNNCGRCIGKCPFGCIETGKPGWKIYIGGRWGKKVAMGRQLDKIFTSEQEVYDTVEKTILFFRSEGKSGERLADTVERVGFENAQAMILGDDLLKRKNEILGIKVTGGATC